MSLLTIKMYYALTGKLMFWFKVFNISYGKYVNALNVIRSKKLMHFVFYRTY